MLCHKTGKELQRIKIRVHYLTLRCVLLCWIGIELGIHQLSYLSENVQWCFGIITSHFHNSDITRIEPVGKPYREVCLQTKLWPWKVHQPNSLSKRLGTWIKHVLAYCRVGRKYVEYVGCIDLLFKVYRATSSTDHIFCFVSLWPWPLPYAPENR